MDSRFHEHIANTLADHDVSQPTWYPDAMDSRFYENLVHVQNELHDLCNALNHIDYDAQFSRWIDNERECFYDMAINSCLSCCCSSAQMKLRK